MIGDQFIFNKFGTNLTFYKHAKLMKVLI